MPFPLLFSLLALPVISLASQTPFVHHESPTSSSLSPLLEATVNAAITKILDDWEAPGAAVALVRMDPNGKWLVETEGYGIENSRGKKMSADSLFNIASNSKLFTSIAVGLLVSNETISPRLDWTTKMKHVVPGWKLKDDIASEQANVMDILSHRSGMPRHDLMGSPTLTFDYLVQSMQYLLPSAEFRETLQYNNLFYMLASRLPFWLLPHRPSFPAYIKEHILLPLGMTSTGTSINDAQKTGKMADGFVREGVDAKNPLGTGRRAREFFLPDDSGESNWGAGGVITSANDVAIWLQTLLLEGRHPETNQTVIPAQVIDQVSTGMTIFKQKSAWPELSPVMYGAGQAISSYRGHLQIEHGGSVPGFRTQITRYPNDQLGIAVFVNDDTYGTQLYEIIMRTIVDLALELEPIDWSARYRESLVKGLANAPSPTQPPSSPNKPKKPLDLPSLPGVYTNPAYGNLTLCPFHLSSSSPVRTECDQLANQIDTILPGVVKKDRPTFVVDVKRTFVSHLRMEWFDGNRWNLSVYDSISPVYPKTTYLAYEMDEVSSTATVEFEVDEETGQVGFGVQGGVWGAGSRVPPKQGKTAKERAEVWFERV